MKVIAIAHRSTEHSAEDFAPHLEAEAHRALTLFAEQSFRELYSRTDGKGAIIVLEAASEDEAREKLESLPLAKLGMLSFDIYGTQPYRGFIANL
ncbi:MAG: superoxide dismutase [Alphaproteobacteria bacterium]|jgi:hypothetical protein|nr:superoxide dismutase [Alphaproteobacteria bacterium]